jgi:hypothetical protein
MSDDKRQKLLDLIDKKAFEPVFNASPSDYKSEDDRSKLAEQMGVK